MDACTQLQFSSLRVGRRGRLRILNSTTRFRCRCPRTAGHWQSRGVGVQLEDLPRQMVDARQVFGSQIGCTFPSPSLFLDPSILRSPPVSPAILSIAFPSFSLILSLIGSLRTLIAFHIPPPPALLGGSSRFIPSPSAQSTCPLTVVFGNCGGEGPAPGGWSRLMGCWGRTWTRLWSLFLAIGHPFFVLANQVSPSLPRHAWRHLKEPHDYANHLRRFPPCRAEQHG